MRPTPNSFAPPSSRRLRLAALVLATALVAAVGCGDDGSAPSEGPAGIYRLESAAGGPLPATVFDGTVESSEGDFHLRVVALEGSLELRQDGHYEHRIRHAVFVDGAPAPEARWTDRGGYRVDADSVRFTSEYIEGVAFAGGLAEDRIETIADYTHEGPAVSYRYARE
ncbi:MAG TPA: hypothetical protein VNK43_10495 [Gemmatimonadales bacterium]|nr:hypothetical protein [Gemmatimonadales bacterium]